jgi:hypothetical protein
VQQDIIDITDDESDRASDREFPEPDQDTEELLEQLTSLYGLRSKIPSAIRLGVRGGRAGGG